MAKTDESVDKAGSKPKKEKKIKLNNGEMPATDQQQEKPKKKKAVKKQPQQPPLKQHYTLQELNPADMRVEDVLDSLNNFVIRATELKQYDLKQIKLIGEQFQEGRCCADFPVTFEMFEVMHRMLGTARNEEDIRILQYFFPLFKQIFMHIREQDLEHAILHFNTLPTLWNEGRAGYRKAPMIEAHKPYEKEFHAARAFILEEEHTLVVDAAYRRKCRELAFYCLLHQRRPIKQLTLAAMRHPDKERTLQNLIKFFHVVPALLRVEHKVSDIGETESLGMQLVRRLNSFELSKEERDQLLDRFVEGLTSGARYFQPIGEQQEREETNNGTNQIQEPGKEEDLGLPTEFPKVLPEWDFDWLHPKQQNNTTATDSNNHNDDNDAGSQQNSSTMPTPQKKFAYGQCPQLG